MTSPRAACAGPAGRFAPPPRAETAGPTSSRPQIPALLAGQAVAQDAQVMCAPGERVLDQLLSRYGESPIGAGVSSDGSVIVTASPTTRSWTLLVSRPDGSLCLLGSGGGWDGDRAGGAEERRPGMTRITAFDLHADRLRELHAAGMGWAEIGRELGIGPSQAFRIGRRLGLVVSRSEANKRAMADPEVKARHAAGIRRAMADPEVKARHAAAMADPEVKARRAAGIRRAHGLDQLSADERADYDLLKRNGYSRAEAFAAIGRSDLLPMAAE